MPRPRSCRRIQFDPRITYFKPRGVPLRNLEVVELTKEEIEALRLKNVLGFDQMKCAKRMNTSQSTFQRILSVAEKKVSEALISGKAISIINE
ncbi:DUF134 domain-containing protein [Patescibacteria group bacterium]